MICQFLVIIFEKKTCKFNIFHKNLLYIFHNFRKV